MIGKVGTGAPARIGGESAPAAEKKGPSRFDAVQQKAAAESKPPTLPPQVNSVSDAKRKELVSEVRRATEAHPSEPPHRVWGPELKDAGAHLDRLKGRVDKLPKSDLTAELQQRLQSIDGQYQSTNKMMDQLQNMSDPRSLLKLQVEMYQITQNLEMVSKAVEQVNSGVKQVMQTQV
jgi:hypothetical protein